MEEIITIILEQAAIWAPSLVAILGMVYSVITTIGKFNKTIDTFKADKTLAEVNAKLSALAAENEELVRTNKLLLDQITKIHNYADAKKKEE